MEAIRKLSLTIRTSKSAGRSSWRPSHRLTDFVNGIVSHANASGRGRDIDEYGLNFMLSVIKGIEPRDQLEAMLAAQMAAVHVASMTFARRLAGVENIPQQDSAERAFNKLTRTFAMQMEALKRYRTGAEQKVTLQHVSVAEGGQAIIGNVTHAPRKNGQTAQERTAREKAATPPPTLPDTNIVPMPIMSKSKERDSLSVRRKSSKMNGNHKRNTGPMLSSLRCGAKPRSGRPCNSPSVHGKKRCRMHGGALGSGAQRGNKNALKHGRYTREAIAERAHLRELMRQARKLLLQIE